MKKRIFSLCALLALASLMAFAADVTGKWASEPPAGGKGGPQTLTLKQDGTKLTGTLEGGRGGAAELSNGSVDGDKVSFEVKRQVQGNDVVIKYTGTVSGSEMKLSFEMGGRGPRETVFKKQ